MALSPPAAEPTAPPRRKRGSFMPLSSWNASVVVERVVYDYADGVLAAAGQSMSAFAQVQLRKDAGNAEFTPLLQYDAELIPSSSGGVRQLRVDSALIRTRSSVIMTVHNTRRVLIKYQANCNKAGKVHPLMRDFALLKKVQSANVTPKVFFLSPPVAFPITATLKTAIGISYDERVACATRPGAHVRFLVMERLGASVEDYVYEEAENGRMISFAHALRFTASLVVAIEKIHRLGVVHGDIHWGNVVLLDQDKPGLIDFGRGHFIDDFVGSEPIWFKPMGNSHCFLSHWNILGYRFSMRDDVLAAIQVGAYMLNGHAYQDYCTGLESSVANMRSFKEEGFLFAVPGLPDRGDTLALGPSDKQTLNETLTEVLALARSVTHVNDIPPYTEIHSALMTAAAITEKLPSA